MRWILCAVGVLIVTTWSVADQGAGSQKPPPASGSGSAARPAPADPGLTPRTPKDLGNDPAKIRAYVDSVYVYGRYLLLEKRDLAGAKKYWGILFEHYPDAKDKCALAKNQIADAEQDAREAAEAAAGSGSGSGPSRPHSHLHGSDRVPPAGSGSGSGMSSEPVPPPPGEAVPPPVELPPDAPEAAEAADPREAADAATEAARKQNALDAKRLARAFVVKSFRQGTYTSSAGDFPELQLSFENADAPKHITLVFYAYSEKGAVFQGISTYFSPPKGRTHTVCCAYDRKWLDKHGKIAAARVEIHCGVRTERALIVATSLHADKAPKDWWLADPTDHMGFYGVGQNKTESGTLKVFKTKK